MTNYDELIALNAQQATRIDELVNTVAMLREEVQRLKDEIATLKGQKPRPKIPPSSLEGPYSTDKQKNTSRIPRGKHPRHKKTNQLSIHSCQRIKPVDIPEGAVFKGLRKYTVQDIMLKPHNTVYELEYWRLPDGTCITGKIPINIHGHYGLTLVAYILNQYYGCRVTEDLLLTELREIGVLISGGQLHNILIENKKLFHQEKNELLPAGIAATGQVKVDDTGARHQGDNWYTTVIGNQFFTFVETTNSKSRVNFLRVLHGTDPQYLINEDTVDYIESLNSTTYLKSYLLVHGAGRLMNEAEWNQFLFEINVTTEGEVKLATEAALFASLLQRGIPKDLGVHGDDAGQFNVFVRSLCWIHEERHYRKIIPVDDTMRLAIEQVRQGIWELYKGLKEYKEAPSKAAQTLLNQKFDDLFLKNTPSPTLNKQLARTYAKKSELLRVLERPDTPLHNNGTETDAREVVVKRKVSGGTRSDEGRKCRDTFVSLKKTCIKLGISFWSYLQDRVSGIFNIPKLSTIIKQRATAQSQGP